MYARAAATSSEIGDGLVGAVGLGGDRAGAEDDDRYAEVAGDVPAVAGRGPTAQRKIGAAGIDPGRLGDAHQSASAAVSNAGISIGISRSTVRPRSSSLQLRDPLTEIIEYGGGRLAGQQPAIGDDDAIGRNDRTARTAVDLTDAPGRRAEQGMGIGGEHRVQPFDLGDHRGGAVDRVRAVGRVARVAGPPVDRDPQIRVAPRRDDRLQIGRLRGDAPDEAIAAVVATYARMPLPVSSSSTTAASSTGPLKPGATQSGQRDQCGREAALHVRRAAAVDPPVLDLPAERIGRPSVTDRYDVRVAEQQQARTVAPGKRDADVVAAGLDR